MLRLCRNMWGEGRSLIGNHSRGSIPTLIRFDWPDSKKRFVTHTVVYVGVQDVTADGDVEAVVVVEDIAVRNVFAQATGLEGHPVRFAVVVPEVFERSEPAEWGRQGNGRKGNVRYIRRRLSRRMVDLQSPY